MTYAYRHESKRKAKVLKWYVLSVCMAVGMNLCGGGT